MGRCLLHSQWRVEHLVGSRDAKTVLEKFLGLFFSFRRDPKASAAPSASGQAEAEVPPPWSRSDYLLLRLAVADISLHAMVDGPQRWEARRARRSDNGKSDGTDWLLIAPGE